MFADESILLGLFVLMFASEKLRPLRHRVQHWLRRLLINLGVAAPSFVVMRLLLIPATRANYQFSIFN
jgi:hypothetical protein